MNQSQQAAAEAAYERANEFAAVEKSDFLAGYAAALASSPQPADGRPAGYFLDTARKGDAPHFEQVVDERKDDSDVFALYADPKDFPVDPHPAPASLPLSLAMRLVEEERDSWIEAPSKHDRQTACLALDGVARLFMAEAMHRPIASPPSAPAQVPGWQPMETAPRDLTEILIAAALFGGEPGEVCVTVGFATGQANLLPSKVWHKPGGSQISKPLAWMPMPSPPVSAPTVGKEQP